MPYGTDNMDKKHKFKILKIVELNQIRNAVRALRHLDNKRTSLIEDRLSAVEAEIDYICDSIEEQDGGENERNN